MAVETKEKAVEVTGKMKAPRSRVAEAGRKRKGVAAPGTPHPRSRAARPDADRAPTRRPRRQHEADTGTREPVAPVDAVEPDRVAGLEGESQPVGVVDAEEVEAASAAVAIAPPETEAEATTTAEAGEAESPANVHATEAVATDAETDAAVSVDPEALLAPEPVRDMAFAIKPQLLKAGLAPVVAALPGKTTLPVLNCILISTEGDGLIRMTATDLDTTVTRTIAASVSTRGAVLVPGKKLGEIAREIPDSCTLDVRLQDDTVHLWCEETRTRYKLATIPVEDFPSPPPIPWETDSFSVPGSTLKLLIERTSFAASTEETRPILNGVLWELAPGSMAMVATNGHRLSVTRVETTGVPTAADPEEVTVVFEEGGEDLPAPDVIIHPRALALVSRLPQDEEDVMVSRTQTYVGFRGAEWEIITRTIPGPYPNYRAVIPQDSDRTMIADRGALAAAVRRMAIVASDQTHRIRLVLGEPMMRVAVETPDLGTAHEDVPVDYEGDPLEIGFNAHYLLELLRFLPAGEVRMCFKGPERAAMLCPVADEDGISTEMLLMPLRLLS
jgi:DNA polymerase-3 subunit beta